MFAVGVIGPRRSRYGTGPYLIAALKRASVQRIVVTASSAGASVEAAEVARLTVGDDVVAASSVGELLLWPRLSGVVVCSPTALRLQHVSAVADAGLPVLAEKPFLGHTYPAEVTAALARRFVEAGLPLHVNYWWRSVIRDLRNFGAIPGWDAISALEIWLDSTLPGVDAVHSAAPHIASMLFELGVREIGASGRVRGGTAGPAQGWNVQFDAGHATAVVGILSGAEATARSRLKVNDIEVLRLRAGSGGLERFGVTGRGIVSLWPIQDVVVRFLDSIEGRSGSDAAAVEHIEGMRQELERLWLAAMG